MAMGQSAYENATNSVARSGMKTGDAGFIAKAIGKGMQRIGAEATKKHESNLAKEAQAAKEAKVAAKEAQKVKAKKSASAAKAAATRKANAAPKPGRMSGSKGIDTRPSGLPTIKPVVLTRTQHFESAVGNAKDTPAKPKPPVKSDIIHSSGIDPSTAYND